MIRHPADARTVDRKYLKWLLPPLVVAVAAGIGIWWAGRPGPVRTSDCEVVSEMITFYRNQIGSTGAVVQSSADEPESLIKVKETTDGLQGYIEQIADPSLHSKAQAVLDNYNQEQRLRKELPEPDPAKLNEVSPQTWQFVKGIAEVARKQYFAFADLRQDCHLPEPSGTG